MSTKLDSFFKSFSDSEEQLDYRMASQTIGEKIPVISTGSLVLDDALTCGGLPQGRLIQYYGAAGSGKTLLTMMAMKEAQQLDISAKQVFIDSEGTFSTDWAETLGIDTSKIIIVSGDTAVNGRKCFEMLLGVPKEDKKHILSGKSKNGLLDNIIEAKGSGEFNINLIILDSLGSIIPPGEDTSAVGKMNISLLSRFLTTTFRKLSLEVMKAKIPFIIINHKRANMDPYGIDHTFAGGNTYAHFLSANIYFEAVQRADSQILDEHDRKIGHTMRATIEKNKLGIWPRKCEFKVNFGIGVVDRHEEIGKLALDYEVVTKPSSMSYEYKDQKWVGIGKFLAAIQEDQNLADELTLKISEARDNKLDKKREEQKDKIAQNEKITSKKEKKTKHVE